jgi:fructose-1,6-bisphosphatase I/sedoheptulose-1,7-bisphosphatase
MYLGRTTLSKFLIQQLTDIPDAGDLGALLVDVAAAVKAIAAMTAKGALGHHLGAEIGKHAQGENPHGLDVLAHEVMIRSCEWGGLLAGMLSAGLEDPYPLPAEYVRGRYLLAFNPLDGSNTDVNVSVGTIFSVLRHDPAALPGAEHYLQSGRQQVAAGYAIYGPATMMVISVGKGTHGFTLDREIGNFILTHPELQIPADTGEFAINTSNARFWEPPVHRYVTECQAGKSGVRGRDFNMRWIASPIADVHRMLMRGGVFMHPKDMRDRNKPARLRLLYEANPVGFLVEQAGGRASTGAHRLLEVQPESLHQRIPLIVGSRHEVERIERYHAEWESGTDKPYTSPLFNERSLFRAEASERSLFRPDTPARV